MLCGKLVTLHGPSVTIKREIEIVQLHLQRGKRARERERESDGRNIASVSPPEMHDDDFMQKGRMEGRREGEP